MVFANAVCLLSQVHSLVLFYCCRSSYPDYEEGQDPGEIEDLSSEKTLECDDETMELILPSGECICQEEIAYCWCAVEGTCHLELPAGPREKNVA